jgi:hypothetical protein
VVQDQPALLEVANPSSPTSGAAIRAPFPVSLYRLLRLELVRQHRDKPEMSEDHSRIQLKNLFSAFLYLMAAGLAHTSIYI